MMRVELHVGGGERLHGLIKITSVVIHKETHAGFILLFLRMS